MLTLLRKKAHIYNICHIYYIYAFMLSSYTPHAWYVCTGMIGVPEEWGKSKMGLIMKETWW